MDVCTLDTIDIRYLTAQERSEMDMVVCESSEQKLLKYDDAVKYLEGYVIPVGFMMDSISNTTGALGDWLVCDGSTFDEIEYPELFKILGGNVLPDATGRITTGTDIGSVGNVWGSYDITLTPEDLPQHTHEYEDWHGRRPLFEPEHNGDDAGGSENRSNPRAQYETSRTTITTYANLTDTPDPTEPIHLIQPSVIVKKLIKAN